MIDFFAWLPDGEGCFSEKNGESATFFGLFAIFDLHFQKTVINFVLLNFDILLFDNSSGEMPEWPKGTVC